MKRTSKTPATTERSMVRCAIYTRKSTDEGLDQAYNSLDAQRDAGEAYVRSQAGDGWQAIPDRYDDGGFGGGSTDRPALRRLLADISAGKVDAVVVYKVDRLSRSLLDFAGLMHTFDQHKVSFVSVTQQFNTATSMGRLVLHVLLSFAQFERELIGERTRDKIAATRRKDKWAGGWPVLGYDVDPVARKLIVNPVEAGRVRVIFALYRDHGSLLPVVDELARRGWRTKAWTTKAGAAKGDRPFTRTGLYQTLTNVVYAGKVRHKDAVHPGEHEAIITADVWEKVQTQLARSGKAGGVAEPARFGAILQGLLRCRPCGCAMTPTHATRGAKKYRYYVCNAAQKKGWRTCPSKTVPAAQMEDLVVAQIRGIGKDPALVREVIEQARQQSADRVAELTRERKGVAAELKALHAEVAAVSARLGTGDDGPGLGRLVDLHARVAAAEGRARELDDQLQTARADAIDPAVAASALAAFDPVWGTLTPQEQGRVLRLLVDRVEYDGGRGKVGIAFRPAGLAALGTEWAITEPGEQV
ncbi:recombinase family protein [Fimbriiglobus ruber]|uniref:Phage DNA invertase n=1 Tax=Fimbriiglobus ruber TaxID=1908690 RepID=A0A225DEH6_9BACT|nr:recombinase family protein [Fimbriiglobus ruber]OWK39940.1 Phage DNA invertase [Fimbriiglobus ruber]